SSGCMPFSTRARATSAAGRGPKLRTNDRAQVRELPGEVIRQPVLSLEDVEVLLERTPEVVDRLRSLRPAAVDSGDLVGDDPDIVVPLERDSEQRAALDFIAPRRRLEGAVVDVCVRDDGSLGRRCGGDRHGPTPSPRGPVIGPKRASYFVMFSFKALRTSNTRLTGIFTLATTWQGTTTGASGSSSST